MFDLEREEALAYHQFVACIRVTCMRIMRPLFLASFAAVLAFGQISQGERDKAMSYLHSSRKLFLDSVANLSPAQLNFKPAPDRWSIAECAEHIAVTEDALWNIVTKKILTSPAVPDVEAVKLKEKDDQIPKVITDRSQKAKAPEQLVPTHQFNSFDELLSHFKESRDRNIAYVQNTQDDLRHHVLPHPAMGPLDAYQWILLIAAHSERHTAQIEEVKSDSEFPK